MLNLKRFSRGAAFSATILLFGCTGAGGKQGAQGPPGSQGVQGPPGENGVVPPLVNEVSGTVTSDGTKGLTGVTVTADPGAETATSDANGAYALKELAVGSYVLTFHKAGYVDQTVIAPVNLAAPTTVDVTLVFDVDGAVGPAVTVSDQLNAGYGAPVSVTAAATGNAPFTYAWTQTGGPTAVLTGADTATISFTTQDFLTSIGYGDPTGGLTAANARFDTLGISIDQANDYELQVVVTDANGVSTSATVTVDSTRPTPGLRMAPIGVPVWLQGNGPLVPLPPVPPATSGVAQTTWSWTLDTSDAPNSKATLVNPTSQFPSFVPDVIGTYKVTETVSNNTLTVYGGTWQGMMTVTGAQDSPPVTTTNLAASCESNCHNGVIAPDKFTPWKGTAHASALQRKIEGSAAGQAFNESCMWCHTVGYDKTAKNNGFDDLAAAAGWKYPAKDQPGNWSALESIQSPVDLADLAGIQCESCHGPQVGPMVGGPHGPAGGDTAARIKWSEEVCASCHQEGNHHYAPIQWRQGAHADRSLALSEGNADTNGTAQHCGRCHSAQGFARYVKGLAVGYYAYLTNDGNPLDQSPAASNHVATQKEMQGFGMTTSQVESQTCAACHDPHSAANPHQLRIYDAVAALPNGMTNVSGMGAGAICITCHNSRNGEHTDFQTQAGNSAGAMAPVANPAAPLTGFGRALHTAAQGDFFFGFNAYFGARYNPSAHTAVADTCVGCHFQATTASEAAAKQTTNHSFVVDSSVCATCHTANVDGKALQAANKLQLDGLRNLLASKMKTTINAALAAGPLVATAYDPVHDVYSNTNAVTVPQGTTVTGIVYMPIGTPADVYGKTAQAGVTLALSAPIPSITFVNGDGSTNNVQTNVGSVSLSLVNTSLYLAPVPPATKTTVTPFSAPTAIAANVQVLYKAYWNAVLLNNDSTFGIHNPSFFNTVVANTSAQLEALP